MNPALLHDLPEPLRLEQDWLVEWWSRDQFPPLWRDPMAWGLPCVWRERALELTEGLHRALTKHRQQLLGAGLPLADVEWRLTPSPVLVFDAFRPDPKQPPIILMTSAALERIPPAGLHYLAVRSAIRAVVDPFGLLACWPDQWVLADADQQRWRRWWRLHTEWCDRLAQQFTQYHTAAADAIALLTVGLDLKPRRRLLGQGRTVELLPDVAFLTESEFFQHRLDRLLLGADWSNTVSPPAAPPLLLADDIAVLTDDDAPTPNDESHWSSLTMHAACWVFEDADPPRAAAWSMIEQSFAPTLLREVASIPGLRSTPVEAMARSLAALGEERGLTVLEDLFNLATLDGAPTSTMLQRIEATAEWLQAPTADVWRLRFEYVGACSESAPWTPGAPVQVYFDGDWVLGVVKSIEPTGELLVDFPADQTRLRLSPLADAIRAVKSA